MTLPAQTIASNGVVLLRRRDQGRVDVQPDDLVAEVEQCTPDPAGSTPRAEDARVAAPWCPRSR